MGKNLETIPRSHIIHLSICLFFPHFPQTVRLNRQRVHLNKSEKAFSGLTYCNISVVESHQSTLTSHFITKFSQLMEIPDGPANTRVCDCRFRSEIVPWFMSLLGRGYLSFSCGSVSRTTSSLLSMQMCTRLHTSAVRLVKDITYGDTSGIETIYNTVY